VPVDLLAYRELCASRSGHASSWRCVFAEQESVSDLTPIRLPTDSASGTEQEEIRNGACLRTSWLTEGCVQAGAAMPVLGGAFSRGAEFGSTGK
jgi:hypothetical protein